MKQMELKIVSETGRERDIVYRNALHVTEPERMLLPFHKGGSFGKLTTSAGLFVYDKLAGVKKEERREMLTAEETLEMEPLVREEGLLGGGHYVEYRTDDARLTIEILKKAAQKGALCLNYMKAEKFRYHEGKVTGITARDMLNDEVMDISATVVVNATGPWVDEMRAKDEVTNDKRLRLSKGTHIVIDQAIFPLRQAIYFDAPDGRMIFAIPRGNKAYIGTTDTFYEDDPFNPVANEEDISYLLDALHYMFPSVKASRNDVEATWAGVRPLIYEEGKDASEISRRDEIWEAGTGLITIAGGKLTGYRKMAETVVDLAVMRFTDTSFGPCVTEYLPLSGGDFDSDEQFAAFLESKSNEAKLYGLTNEEGRMLASLYGTNVDQVFTYFSAVSTEKTSLPAIWKAKILYAIHHEMAMTPSDFFIRRKGDLFFNIVYVKLYKEAVANYMGAILSYTDETRERYLSQLEKHIAEAEGKVVERV